MLVQPYTEFKVVNIKENVKNTVNGQDIDIYEMEEVPQIPLKNSPILYILWVGPKK